jgi:hypothetical protein
VFAYNNPNLFYAVIKNDFGLGIISKKKIKFVKKIFNNDKQKQFLNLVKNNKHEEAYNFYKSHSADIINAIG